MATVEKALQIAAQAHEGQKDKEGQPYILHPLRVMKHVEGEAAQIVAILHDVVEDTQVTLDDLRRAGFTEAVLQAVQCVTHHKDQPYAEYVIACKDNPIARQVKLGDLADNCRLDRTILRPARLQRDLARIHRYFLSYRFLTDQITEQEYRSLMDQCG
jgi:hypothetical protein